MAYQLGIDLGTTFTCAAVCRSSGNRWGEPEVVTLGSRGATVPSVVFVGQDGSIVVGEAAERRALTDPDCVVREFKRRIGDPTPVMVAGRPWAPQDLSAWLVRWVVDRVAEREGGPAERIAVTHPAAWGQHKKELLGAALANQGLSVTFMAEPQAAAMSYATNERVSAGSTIAVYDFGGGTFDAAVVRKGDVDFRLVGRPEGLERLGGIDFDQAVFEHVLEGMPDAFAELDESDPAVLSAVARIRRECTEAKEALSSDTEVSIPVLLPGSRGSVRLHRSEFEAMIRPQVEDTVAALRSAVISAGFAPDQLTAVLLVGGTSRIPLVAQLVSEQLGRPVAVDADPKNAIAKGAALSLAPQPAVAAPVGGPGMQQMQQGPPPARPPRMAPPPPGMPGVPYGGPYNEGPYNDGPRGGQGIPPHDNRPGRHGPPARPAPEPTAAMLTEPPARQVRPAAHQQPEPEWDYDDYEDEPDQPERRRPNTLAIGLGALLAVGAVVLAFVLWPTSSPTDSAGNESSLTTPTSSGSGGSGGGSRGSGGGGGAGPAAPPAGEATVAPPTSAEEEPPAATKTTTKASEPTKQSDPTKKPDSGSDADGDSSSDTDAGSESGGSDGDSNAAGPETDLGEVEPEVPSAAPGL
jgi:molecular chaperone DnaK